ncbi:MAG: 3-dehydroquinate synthase [Bacteroidales bacterium]|jgi:3-dehydroquinate synthase|nr:3-dehydroquinate synthase [Bacteroidales bacterium]
MTATPYDIFNKEYHCATKFVLVDENTRKYGLPHLLQMCPTLQNARIIEICAGEQHKNLETFAQIIEQLSENNADRKSVLINLGGGMICDIGGFAAACYKRGIDFVNIPTTLLAMVDAAHGGKTGVDFQNFKNQIGVFALAKHVIVDVEFLKTLPKIEILSGFAEIVKMALITDINFWDVIKDTDLENSQTLQPLITEAIEKKMQIANEDPTEQNIRKILNFGHTFGHAFETFALENGEELSHGHAVTMGMLCELWLSEKILNFDSNQRNIISEFILSKYPKFPIQTADFERLFNILLQDKKNNRREIKPILLEKIGQPQYDLNCSQELCLEAFQAYTTFKKI